MTVFVLLMLNQHFLLMNIFKFMWNKHVIKFHMRQLWFTTDGLIQINDYFYYKAMMSFHVFTRSNNKNQGSFLPTTVRSSKNIKKCMFVLIFTSACRLFKFLLAALTKEKYSVLQHVFFWMIPLLTINSNEINLALVFFSLDDETENNATLWNIFLCNCEYYYNTSLNYLLTLWYFQLLTRYLF